MFNLSFLRSRILMSKVVMYTIQVVSFRYLVHKTFYNNYCVYGTLGNIFPIPTKPNPTSLFSFFEIYYFNGS